MLSARYCFKHFLFPCVHFLQTRSDSGSWVVDFFPHTSIKMKLFWSGSTKPFQQESPWRIVEIKANIYDFPVHVNSIEISAYFKNLFFPKNVNNFNWNPTINSSHLLGSSNKAQSPDIKRQLLVIVSQLLFIGLELTLLRYFVEYSLYFSVIYTHFYISQKTSCLIKTNADESLLSDWNRLISKKPKPSRKLLFQNSISIQFFLRFSLLSLLGYRLANIKKQHFTSN